MPFCLSNVNTQTIHRSWRGRKTLFASFMQSMTRALHELGKGLSRGSEVGASSHGGSHVAQLRPPALGSDARAAGVWFNGTLSPLSSPLLLSLNSPEGCLQSMFCVYFALGLLVCPLISTSLSLVCSCKARFPSSLAISRSTV